MHKILNLCQQNEAPTPSLKYSDGQIAGAGNESRRNDPLPLIRIKI